MVKRQPTQPIPPFPANISRDYFGAWLSGFTDGEGCFFIGFQKQRSKKNDTIKKSPIETFGIRLRIDDIGILTLINSYLRCGSVITHDHCLGHRQAVYKVYDLDDLVNIVIPHFEKFPLLAKKKRDFAIWKEAVTFAHRIKKAPRRMAGGRKGRLPSWTDEQRAYFEHLVAALKATREPSSTSLPPPKKEYEYPLFDRSPEA